VEVSPETKHVMAGNHGKHDGMGARKHWGMKMRAVPEGREEDGLPAGSPVSGLDGAWQRQ
jgi:hypothetical protein